MRNCKEFWTTEELEGHRALQSVVSLTYVLAGRSECHLWSYPSVVLNHINMMVMDPVTPLNRNLMRMSREALSDNSSLIEKLRGNLEQRQIRCSTVRWILSVSILHQLLTANFKISYHSLTRFYCSAFATCSEVQMIWRLISSISHTLIKDPKSYSGASTCLTNLPQVMTMSSSSVETRDSAIQMLDKFLAVLGRSWTPYVVCTLRLSPQFSCRTLFCKWRNYPEAF